VALVDFGCAREVAPRGTYRATVAGTFGYMPPEALGGTLDRSADVYGLGATLVHVLSRRPPEELLWERGAGSLAERLNVSAPFAALLRRMVAPDRDARFATAADALAALEALRHPAPAASRRKTGKPRRKNGRRRKGPPPAPPKPRPLRVAPSPDAAILSDAHPNRELFEKLTSPVPPRLSVAFIALLCVSAAAIALLLAPTRSRSTPRRAETRVERRVDPSPRGGLLLVRLTQPVPVSRNGVVLGYGSAAIPIAANAGVIHINVGSCELALAYHRDPAGVTVVARAPGGGVWADGRPESDTLSFRLEGGREVTLNYRTTTREALPPVVLRFLP
jgi:hypothetical protein